jgi:hypothetical protein
MADIRDAVVAPLIVLAGGADYQDRADAGRPLAVFAEMQQTGESLVALVLDPCDTSVTRATTEALLRRHDRAGYVLVARAIAMADDNHADWIHTAILDVLGVYGRERDAAIRECKTLLDDADEQIRTGTRLLITWLGELTPVLVPGDT